MTVSSASLWPSAVMGIFFLALMAAHAAICIRESVRKRHQGDYSRPGERSFLLLLVGFVLSGASVALVGLQAVIDALTVVVYARASPLVLDFASSLLICLRWCQLVTLGGLLSLTLCVAFHIHWRTPGRVAATGCGG